MKKIAAFLLGILFVVFLISCGHTDNGLPIETTKPNNKVNKIIIEETNMEMFNNKTTDYKIIIPLEPSASDIKAVDELKYFFKQATDIDLLVETETDDSFNQDDKHISIGKTNKLKNSGIQLDSKKLGRDGYIIKTIGNTVFLAGATGNGTVFSVYRFLSAMFNYRYFAKDEIRLENKTKGNLINFDIIECPSIESRNLDAYALYHDYEYLTRMRLTPAMGRKTDYFVQGWSTLNDQSMATQILPYDKYKDREGWFSGDIYTGQMNVTKAYYDDEMFNEFTNNLINNFIAVEKDCKYFMLGINDNKRGWRNEPHIEDYDKYKASGVMIRFMNKVSDRVQEWIDQHEPGREVYLVMFAYLYTLDPPVVYDEATNSYQPIDESVVCKDNIMVRIAPIESKNMYPHMDSKVNPTAAYAFAGWSAVAKNLAVWDYGTNFSSYIAPYPDWGTIQQNLKMYRDKGVRDILTQLPAHTQGTSLHDYKIFMRSELMWNVDADYKSLHNEFFENYYREAAPVMQKYFDYLVMTYASKANLYQGSLYYNLYSSSFWSYDNTLQLERYIDEAKEAILPIKEKDPDTYNKVYARLTQESLFYRYLQIEVFGDYYSKSNLFDMINSFKADAEEAKLVAVSNQTYFSPTGRTDEGLMIRVLERWRKDLLN